MFGSKKKEKKPKGGFLRENIEALTVAIAMALVIKQFAFEAYKVPTESMEPTIIGRAEGGDRIIVNKTVYDWRDPRRWEVAIFRYPLNVSVNYVKRIVGMPSEWVFIRNGDVFRADPSLDREAALGAMEVLRKPDDLQEALFDAGQLIPPDKRAAKHFNDYWAKEPSSKGQIVPRAGDDEVVFRAEDGKLLVAFQRPEKELTLGGEPVPQLSNRRYDNWSPYAKRPGFIGGLIGSPGPATGFGPRPGFIDALADVRVRAEFMPESAGTLHVVILDGTHGLPLELSLAAGKGESRLVAGDEVKELDVTLESGEWTEVELRHYDDRLILFVDGDEVTRLDYEHGPVAPNEPVLSSIETSAPSYPNGPAPAPRAKQPTANLEKRNNLLFGFEGGRMKLRDLDLARDIYYTYAGATDFRIPEKSYLMMGDNSPDSLDGRGWKETILRYDEDGEEIELRGDAEGVSADESKQRPFRNPYPEDGVTKFIDQFGNECVLDPDRIKEQRTVYGHFVHRDQIMGRAYVTFWPPRQWGVIR